MVLLRNNRPACTRPGKPRGNNDSWKRVKDEPRLLNSVGTYTMNRDESSRAATLEQLRQKRQRGEKNKYEGDVDDVSGEDSSEREEGEEQPKQKRSKKRRGAVPCKKLSDFAGFSVNAEIDSPGNDRCSLETDDASSTIKANGSKNDNGSLPDPASTSLKVYILDVYEDSVRKPGDVYLIGKTKSETSGEFDSCCIRIRGILRRIFVLPRRLRFDPITKKETETVVSFDDVEEELSKELKRFHIKNFTISKQPTTRKYCLSAGDVPSAAEYLELRYPFNQTPLPPSFSGATFSHAFGTTSTGLEIFLLECKLRLPCWIELANTGKSTAPFSWCAVEIDLEQIQPSDIRVLADVGMSVPPLNLLSLSVKTMPNVETGRKEIIAVALWFLSPYFVDKETQDESKWRHLCVVRKGVEHAHLFDLKAKLAKETTMKVRVEENERALLSCVLVEIHKFNTDVIVGHDLWDFELPMLISRVADKLQPQIQRLGWLRRSATAARTYTKFDLHDLLAGRLICDLKVMAMEFILRSRSYDLTQLASQILNEQRDEIADEAVSQIYESSVSLINFTKLTLKDANLCWRLMAKLRCLQLTSEITRIAGGVWSKTLTGGRAERTEFLLLHAFEAAGYIVPEKQKAKKSLVKDTEEMDEEDQALLAAKRKASYVGGLVLEPKKGLYDTFVLLLDFNSLYPSIIMEYNVCFTTVDQRGQDNTQIADLPEPGLAQGILPNEVRKLVESRKAVKQLMKDPKITPDRYQEYNIRQQALKITANSMYGCLGFSNSRFYAKPLAALITSQGREILMDTKHLVEKFHLEVIYGDTDSIMINTNSRNLEEVLAVGKKVKAEVNKRYRQLELDIDGVYKKLLLYKKKKYAGLLVDLPAASDGNENEINVNREMKGLDIVRRDCPPIAVEAGCRVLDELLSDCETSETLDRIYNYLSNLADSMRNGDIPIEKYEVSKQLSRPPEQYPDKKQPHVTVALRLNAGGRHLKQGDVVPYVICQNGTTDSATQRAYHRSEIEASENLQIDLTYYLSQQVHPVVVRLLEPLNVAGADAVKVAECLGLDTSHYRRHISTTSKGPSNDTYIDEFAGCQPFTFKCPECSTDNEITSPFVEHEGAMRPSLDRCINESCRAKPYKERAMLNNQLLVLVREFIRKHYQNWCICEDCGYRTRYAAYAVGVGEKAQCPACLQAGLHQEYPADRLYSQLSYFQHIFDLSTVGNSTRGRSNAKNGVVNNDIRAVYDQLKKSMDGVVSCNGYAQIDLGQLFSLLS